MRPRTWISDNLKIINKDGVLVPLVANVGQIMLDNVVELQRSHGYPVRIILLKPRQVGWSTWSEALGFHYINTTSQRSALVVSADIDSTDFVFRMSKTFQSHINKGIRFKTSASSRKEIVYKDSGSRFITQTAGKDVLGRGGTVHFFHGSEVAFWPHAKEGLAALFQMIPNTPETTVILESTANGVGGAFYDLFFQAVDRFRETGSYHGYIPVFFPWYKFTDYSTLVPKGFRCTEEERELKGQFGMDDGQLFWRRLKIEELGGDESLFKQEYPATALEAFQVAGNPVFSNSIMSRERGRSARNPRFCILEEDGPEDVERIFNCWQIAYLPVEGHEYTIGIDTQESTLSDQSDPKSRLDRHGVAVFDRNEGRYVAIYWGQGPQHDLGVQCLRAAKMYNNAWVGPEVPHGMEVLKMFREEGYQYIYQRQTKDEQYDTSDTDNLGWRTTLITRRWLVESLKTAMIEGSVRIVFKDILDEMDTFCYDKSGKPVHRPGKHDDLLFGAMIALQIHLRMPLNPQPYANDVTGEEYKEVSMGDLAMIGAIDPGPGVEDDD